jgi:hypothetical protein
MTLSITKVSITTLSIMTLSMTTLIIMALETVGFYAVASSCGTVVEHSPTITRLRVRKQPLLLATGEREKPNRFEAICT